MKSKEIEELLVRMFELGYYKSPVQDDQVRQIGRKIAVEMLENQPQQKEEWRRKAQFLWQKYKRAKGNISVNQSSVEEFERMMENQPQQKDK